MSLQRATVVSSALRSIWSCVALVGFWAVEPPTQQSFPLIWSNADCRSVFMVQSHFLNVTPRLSITVFCPFFNAPICMKENEPVQLWNNFFLPWCIDSHDCLMFWSDHNMVAWFCTSVPVCSMVAARLVNPPTLRLPSAIVEDSCRWRSREPDLSESTSQMFTLLFDTIRVVCMSDLLFINTLTDEHSNVR